MLNSLAPPSVAPFPASVIEACVRGAIATAAADQATLRGGAVGGGAAWEPEVDSLVVLAILTALQEQVGIELPDDVVPPGGFADVEACVGTLLGHALTAWDATQAEVVA